MFFAHLFGFSMYFLKIVKTYHCLTIITFIDFISVEMYYMLRDLLFKKTVLVTEISILLHIHTMWYPYIWKIKGFHGKYFLKLLRDKLQDWSLPI